MCIFIEIDKINIKDDQITADGAYDKNHIYESLTNAFSKTEISIPPDSNSILALKTISKVTGIINKSKCLVV